MEKAGAYDSEAGMHADHEEAQEVKRQTRKAARVTGSKRTAPKDRATNPEDEDKKLQALAEYGRANRDYSAYTAERLNLIPSMKRIRWAESDEE
jgi:predicted transcriptional regulator